MTKLRYRDIKLNDMYVRWANNKPQPFKVVGLSRKVDDGTNQKVYFEHRGYIFIQSKKEFESTKWLRKVNP